MKAAAKLGLAALTMAAASALSAPITFNTALPVHEGGYVLREQFMVMKIADDPTPMRRDMRVSGVMSVLGYGVTRDFALFGMLPWFDKRLDMRMGGQDITRSKSGIGDLTLLGRYTAYEDNGPGRTLRLAPFLAIKAPTGEDKAGDRLGSLPPPLQPGSGSWDVLGGAVLTYQTLDFQVDSQLSYQATREANGFQAGKVLQFDASLQYRLLPRSLDTGVPAFLYGMLEANLVRSARDRIAGADDPNSGGTTLFVTPGLQYVTRKWIAEAGVQLPVRQHLNGSALKNNYLFTTGVRINF
ncbi:MAG: transporter [Burkholderiales bacterium]|nr:transporter [Burkholderiales bacterium]